MYMYMYHYDCMYTDALDVIDKINIIPHHPGHYFCLVCPKKQVIDLYGPRSYDIKTPLITQTMLLFTPPN